LQRSARLLRDSNQQASAATTTADSAKKFLFDWLQKERGLDVATLPIGEFVHIEGVMMLEIGAANKFDAARFEIDHPDLYSEYKKKFPIKKPKCLA